MKTRLLAVPLVLVMIVSSLPAGAVAQKDDDPFTDQLSPKEALRTMERLINKRDPATLDRLGASSDSLDLLEAYNVETLAEVASAVFANIKGGGLSDGQSASASPAGAYTPDEMLVTKGFKVEVLGPSGGKNEDNAWEACTGGALNIEVAPASVGSDEARNFSAGKAEWNDIVLKGPLTATRESMRSWFSDANATPEAPFKVIVTITGENDTARAGDLTTTQSSVDALAAYWFKDELLVFTLDPKAFTLTVITLSRLDANGKSCPAPPQLLLVGPTTGIPLLPIAIGGTGFDRGTIPYLNSMPSISLFNWNVQNIPLIGSIAVGFTIVPPAAPSGSGDVRVEYFGQMSNPFPFTVDGASPNGGDKGSQFVTGLQLAFDVRATNAAKKTSPFSADLSCQMDWGNTTMPSAKEDVVSGTETRVRTSQVNTTVSMDVEKPSLSDWLFDWDEGKDATRNLTVKIGENRGTGARTYNLVECFPISFSGGDFTTGAESNLAELRVNATRVELA